MSSFLYTKPCPRCRKLGNDRSGNNLAHYSDGHTYCFACGFKTKGDVIERIKSQVKETNTETYTKSNIIPNNALVWLKKYGLTDAEIYDNFFWDDNGYLVFDGKTYQCGRNFNSYGAKYKTKGVIKGNEVIFVPVNNSSDTIVIVEDHVSAIKVSRVCASVALSTATISLGLLARLSNQFKHAVIWLDPDKQKESVREAEKAKSFFDSVKVVWSDKDPKEHTVNEIKELLK
jgi:hypothetical protein